MEVYFEKENIFTLDFKGEPLITIMSSLAQEESRSISENTTWGQRKRFADGIMSLGYSNFLGYKKGANPGDMEIVEEEAVIVCRIYGYENWFYRERDDHQSGSAYTSWKTDLRYAQ